MRALSVLAFGRLLRQFFGGNAAFFPAFFRRQSVGLDLFLGFLCKAQRLEARRLGIERRTLLLDLCTARIFALLGRFEVALRAIARTRGIGHDSLSMVPEAGGGPAGKSGPNTQSASGKTAPFATQVYEHSMLDAEAKIRFVDGT